MRKRTWGFIASGLLVSLLLAGVVSGFASADPDGLESALREGCTVDAEGAVTGGDCPAQREQEHEIGGPLADYGVTGIADDALATGLSGVVGVLLTFALAGGGFWLVRRRAGQQTTGDGDGAAQPTSAAGVG
ncbi:PDGLE domain-containing protein [Salinispora fenicalii]|uniref:PDGLE domain-containing protein n=1 Tax=Salinispora fenicalii TaxID=1137263 RepID=UPI00047F10F4|nr:PDGLE domain-containing protein [Salinispora fenicalii]